MELLIASAVSVFIYALLLVAQWAVLGEVTVTSMTLSVIGSFILTMAVAYKFVFKD